MIRWCDECPSYKKETEYEKKIFLDYGNGSGDYTYETKALCIKYNQYVEASTPACEECQPWFIAEQIKLEQEIELLCQEKL